MRALPSDAKFGEEEEDGREERAFLMDLMALRRWVIAGVRVREGSDWRRWEAEYPSMACMR